MPPSAATAMAALAEVQAPTFAPSPALVGCSEVVEPVGAPPGRQRVLPCDLTTGEPTKDPRRRGRRPFPLFARTYAQCTVQLAHGCLLHMVRRGPGL